MSRPFATTGASIEPVRLADAGEHRRDQLRRGRAPRRSPASSTASFAERQPSEGGPLNLRCWPQRTTSDIPLEEWRGHRRRPAWMTGRRHRLAPPCRTRHATAADHAVDQAEQEELGDLKLYRIPEPVTVAANAARSRSPCSPRDGVQVRHRLPPATGDAATPCTSPGRRSAILRHPQPRPPRASACRSRPAGLLLFGGARRPMLLGQGTVRDRAVGEDVEVHARRRAGRDDAPCVLSRTAAAERLSSSSSATIGPRRLVSKGESRRTTNVPLAHPARAAQRHAALGGHDPRQRPPTLRCASARASDRAPAAWHMNRPVAWSNPSIEQTIKRKTSCKMSW